MFSLLYVNYISCRCFKNCPSLSCISPLKNLCHVYPVTPSPLIESFKAPGIQKSYKKHEFRGNTSLHLRNSHSMIYKCKNTVLEQGLNQLVQLSLLHLRKLHSQRERDLFEVNWQPSEDLKTCFFCSKIMENTRIEYWLC